MEHSTSRYDNLDHPSDGRPLNQLAVSHLTLNQSVGGRKKSRDNLPRDFEKCLGWKKMMLEHDSMDLSNAIYF